MNGPFVILGVFAVSMVMVSILAYRMKLRFRFTHPALEEPTSRLIIFERINSSLEEDLKDILSCVPLDRINEIFYDYLMYDKQIANTCSFIDDQGTFLLQEIQNMPHTNIMTGCLRDIGLSVEHWQSEVPKFWKNLPRFERNEPRIAAGGLTVMIQKMLQLVPKDQLHTILRSKARHSGSFRVFILLLCSPVFIDMCQQIDQNPVLRRHLYWAIEADIEAIFALELMKALHSYLIDSLA